MNKRRLGQQTATFLEQGAACHPSDPQYK